MKGLIGIDGERVWVARSYNKMFGTRVYKQLRELLMPLDGLISLLYEDGKYEQWCVNDTYWEPVWKVMQIPAPMDYFKRLGPIASIIRSRCLLLHQGQGNYTTRFGQPFWPQDVPRRGERVHGGYVGDRPGIKDRAYIRFMLRNDGRGPASEEDWPNIADQNETWRELQDARAFKIKSDGGHIDGLVVDAGGSDGRHPGDAGRDDGAGGDPVEPGTGR